MNTLDKPVVPRGGHRRLPHHAYVVLSAWAPTRDECVEQAVLGLVSCFAEAPRQAPDRTVRFRLCPDTDGALIVGVLEEAVFAADARGLIPVRTHLWSTGDGGVSGEFDAVPSSAVRIRGRLPKAVMLNELTLAGDGTWRCKITIDA